MAPGLPTDVEPYVAPLCPAGHLPHRGGDWLSPLLSPTLNIAKKTEGAKLLISPLVGEMSGRTEGGARELRIAKRGSDPHRHQDVERVLVGRILDQRRRAGVGQHEAGLAAGKLCGYIE